ALARGDATPDAALRLAGPGGGLQIVQLHLTSSSPLIRRSPSLAPAPVSSTVTRKRTWRTMPRVASLAGTSTLEPMPCSPSARSVARFRAMWLIELLTWVTRRVPVAVLPGIDGLRGGLAGDVQSNRDPAP